MSTGHAGRVFSTNITRPVAETYGTQGISLNLEPLIEEYGHSLKELFEHNRTVNPLPTAYDGNIDLTMWDNYLAQLDAVGLQEYLAIYQSAYDRYFAVQ